MPDDQRQTVLIARVDYIGNGALWQVILGNYPLDGEGQRWIGTGTTLPDALEQLWTNVRYSADAEISRRLLAEAPR